MASEKKITLKVIVSGQAVSLSANMHQKVEHLVHQALQETGNKGQPPEDWEFRTAEGRLISQAQTIEEAELRDGATVFLNPKAGAGGDG